MSYDLFLGPPEMFEEEGEMDDRSLPPSAAELERHERLVESLHVINPDFDVFRVDPDKVALAGLSSEDSLYDTKTVELTSEANGIQISLEPQSASITMAYWHNGNKAQEAFRELWSYLEVIVQETSWVAFDAQLGRPLDIALGFEEAMSIYGEAMGMINETIIPGYESQKQKIITSTLDEDKKPWWRFW